MGNPRSVKALYIVKQKGRNSYDSEGNPGAGAVEGRLNKWYLKLEGTVEYLVKQKYLLFARQFGKSVTGLRDLSGVRIVLEL